MFKIGNFQSGFAAKGVLLLVEDSITKIWEEFRQTNETAPEACGILMATIDPDSSRIWLEKITIPKKSDRRTRFSFQLKGKGHEQELQKQAKISGGTIRLLGTWHTHPEPDPTPSQADITGWMKLKSKNPQFHEFCFIIVGLKTTVAYLGVGQIITKMNPIQLALDIEK